jgi:phospholipase/carboxylesterase
MPLLLLGACGNDGTAPVPPARFVTRTVEPRSITPGQEPPLVVLLHGIGADEHDLLPLAAHLDPRLRVTSVRAPQSYAVGSAWFHIDFRRDGTIVPDVAQARAALVDLVQWLPAPPARTFLLGFSQGAMMALGVLGAAPERLAGVVALSGRSPDGLFEATASPDAIARVPVLLAHGTHDDVLPVANGRQTEALLAGRVHDLTYREFPIGHGISDEEFSLVAAWISARLDERSPR